MENNISQPWKDAAPVGA